MTDYEIYEMAQRLELGIPLSGPYELTKEIIAEKMLFSSLKNQIGKLPQKPIS